MESLPAELFDQIAPDPCGWWALFNTCTTIRNRLLRRIESVEYLYMGGRTATTRTRLAYICTGQWVEEPWKIRRTFEIISDRSQLCDVMFVAGLGYNHNRLAYHNEYHTTILWCMTQSRSWMHPCIVYTCNRPFTGESDGIVKRVVAKTPQLSGYIKYIDPIYKI